MICPMLSALKPTDDYGNPVDRECIYDNCRFFNQQQRDCNLMMASRAMLKMAEQGPQAAAPALSPTALTDMERRLTDVGKGLLHSSMEVIEVIRHAGQESIGKVTEVGTSLTQRFQGLELQLKTGPHDFETRLAAGLDESEARTAQGLQAYLGEMRATFDETMGRVQARLEEQGRGVGATAAAASQSLDQLAAITDLQQKVAERLLEEMSLLSANARKLEQMLASIDKKLGKSADEGLQISQQLLLVKGQ